MGTFFIQRPVFAWVLAIVTMLAGVFSLLQLPTSQYPHIAPTTIRISTSYTGATAEAVETSVTRIIEDGMTGLDGLVYMQGNSRAGSSSLTLTFNETVDPIDAQNDVQARINRVLSRLPDLVQDKGVTVSRTSEATLMVGAIVSTTGEHDTRELGDILNSTVESAIQRVEGVGGINSFGSGYAMRIWLDPIALSRFQLSPTDVTSAVQAQNTTVSVGSLGVQPAVQGQQFTANITAQSKLTTVDEFKNIILKTDGSGASVYLSDVADVEIGQRSYGGDARFNGYNASGFSVNLASGANAIATAEAVRAEMERLETTLPDGVRFEIAYDTSPFVERSISQVYYTIAEAVILVFAVLLLFLQSWRATIIPIVAIPVVLLGVAVVLLTAGYSINSLTMFAMVLAIGLLVDDAIVVVENVERIMHDEGLGPIKATWKSMSQISSALVGIVVVLSAVFIPMAFMPGATGIIYRQFTMTIVTSMLLSLAVAFILTPALCGSVLKRSHGDGNFITRGFNSGFASFTNQYGRIIEITLRAPLLALAMLAIVSFGAYHVYGSMKSSFIPDEDQGVLMSQISLQEGATAVQTLAVVEEVEGYLRTSEGSAVASTFTSLGFGFGGGGQNQAMIFIKLKDFDDRDSKAHSAAAVAQRFNANFANNRKARIIAMQPPAIVGLGDSSGFSMQLVDIGGNGVEALIEAGKTLERIAKQDDRVANVEARGVEPGVTLKLHIDRQKAESLGVNIADVNRSLSIIFAGSQVNDFELGARLSPVIVQGAAAFRMQSDDIDAWFAKNNSGEMVPYSEFMHTTWESVSPSLARMDAKSSLTIRGEPAPGLSSGTAMQAMEELVRGINGGYAISWTGMSYQEKQAGDQILILYILSALVVFLALAALYESWTVPVAVLLSVPVGILGTVFASYFFGQSDDIYFKVGMMTTIGLAARNAILIVEFAEALLVKGENLKNAAIISAQQRLRPILMTSLAFILGVLPLATASGAGAGAQQSIGIAVVGGMISSTTLGLVMVPALYVLVRNLIPHKSTNEYNETV